MLSDVTTAVRYLILCPLSGVHPGATGPAEHALQSRRLSLPWHRITEAAAWVLKPSDVPWPWRAQRVAHAGSWKTEQTVLRHSFRWSNGHDALSQHPQEGTRPPRARGVGKGTCHLALLPRPLPSHTCPQRVHRYSFPTHTGRLAGIPENTSEGKAWGRRTAGSSQIPTHRDASQGRRRGCGVQEATRVQCRHLCCLRGKGVDAPRRSQEGALGAQGLLCTVALRSQTVPHMSGHSHEPWQEHKGC